MKNPSLTSAQRRVLRHMVRNIAAVRCTIGAGPTVFFTKEAWRTYKGSMRFATLRRLEELGMVERRTESDRAWEWHVTDAGKQVVMS